MSRDTRFLLLSAGTIAFIQLSCIIEEWIFKSLPDFHYFWFVALVELALFTLFGGMAQWREAGVLPTEKGPRWLYAAVGICLAGGTGLGKVAYRYLNYTTGTVLKSMKLLPVMALSVCWLRRRFSALQVLAACLMVVSAACFGLGEAELEPSFHPLGIALSFGCLLSQALQNNAADRLLTDHAANVHEVMALSNGYGALTVLCITIANGELQPALAYFGGSAVATGLLVLRCALFYLGALFYTMLMQHSGAVSAVFVTTMRKALTVSISFVLFPKPWSHKYLLGLIFLLAAIVSEYQGKKQAPATTAAPRASAPGTRGPNRSHDEDGGDQSESESIIATEEQPLQPRETGRGRDAT